MLQLSMYEHTKVKYLNDNVQEIGHKLMFYVILFVYRVYDFMSSKMLSVWKTFPYPDNI